MIIGKELSSYTYTTANWVLLCRRSRSNHTYRTETLCFVIAVITLLVSIFVLLAPSMHWRCTEEKANVQVVCLYREAQNYMHASTRTLCKKGWCMALTFETIAG